MYPMSSLMQYLLIFCALALCTKPAFSNNSSEWKLSCKHETNITVDMYKTINITCDIEGPEKAYSEHVLIIQSHNTDLVKVKNVETWLKHSQDTHYGPEFIILEGVFIGETNITVQIRRRDDVVPQAEETIHIVVTKQWDTLDIIFHVSVIGLVTLMYINFGCAFNWSSLRENMRRPISPVIGLTVQVVCMPLLGFILGRILFPGNTHMQLGLFFSGVVPSGGASNMWTLILGGNLDLSITMTALSMILALATMPFWAFTLGRVIYHEGKMDVPYTRIMYFSVCLIIPLFIGYLVQRFLPKVSNFLVRILKGFSLVLLISIIVFATITQSYIFKLFSWQIVLAGLGLPWSGYLIAYVVATLLGRDKSDAMTIAIETGIQNTGLAIGVVKNTLGQPAGDIAIVVPIAVAIMTPFPLLAAYLYKLIRRRIDQKECGRKGGRKLMDTSLPNSPTTELLVDNDNNFNVTGPKTHAKLKLDDNYFTTMDLQCNI